MESGMVTDAGDAAATRERLSALVDGELGDAQATQACAQWRGDGDLRATWHAYQLIGDVLRSDDLCSAPGHDADFLAAFRSRLAEEPVVLAPQANLSSFAPSPSPSAAAAGSGAVPRPSEGRRGWRTPVAVAAGFVAVVGVVVATRLTAPAPESSVLARSSGVPTTVAAQPVVAGATESATPPVPAAGARALVASGQLIRDVRLDRYLSAHKQFAGSSALGVPSGFLRNATADAADR